jgi:hypothetical protein
LEVSPFASSFVAGSRPNGRYVTPVEKLGFDIVYDDWIISYMKYPIATQGKTQNHYNTSSIGKYTADNSKGYLWFGKNSGYNKYRIHAIFNDASILSAFSGIVFNPEDYFYHWHYEVLKKQGNVISYYVDAVKQCEITIPEGKLLQSPFDLGLSMGESFNMFPNNSLFANIGYGRLQAGEFTDAHIQSIYSANAGFTVKSGQKIY